MQRVIWLHLAGLSNRQIETYVSLGREAVGLVLAENAALIADARTSLPRALDALEAVLAFATAERDKISRTYIVQPNTAYAGYANAMDDVIRTVETALRAES